MKNVCVVVTARPSYSRIRSALFALRQNPDVNLQLVVAASALLEKYGSVVKEVKKDGFEIAASVYSVIEGENLVTSAKTTGMGIIELSSVFFNIKPDVVVTIADRYETIATAIAASYMNIPLVHIQGGEVTGNIDEKVRHAITKLADLHLVANEKARERVIRMGEFENKVIVTGCPSIDIARDVVLNRPELDFEPWVKYHGVGHLLPDPSKYIVVMQHPVTTEIEQGKEQIKATLAAASELDLQVFWFWPNVDAGSDSFSNAIRTYRETIDPKNIYFFKNMSPDDFLVLLNNSQAIVGNSSVAIRECAYLGVPAVNVGSRQSGRERGQNVIDTHYDKNEILSALNIIFSRGRLPGEPIYGDGLAGENIAKAIMESQIDINKILSY